MNAAYAPLRRQCFSALLQYRPRGCSNAELSTRLSLKKPFVKRRNGNAPSESDLAVECRNVHGGSSLACNATSHPFVMPLTRPRPKARGRWQQQHPIRSLASPPHLVQLSASDRRSTCPDDAKSVISTRFVGAQPRTFHRVNSKRALFERNGAPSNQLQDGKDL